MKTYKKFRRVLGKNRIVSLKRLNEGDVIEIAIIAPANLTKSND